MTSGKKYVCPNCKHSIIIRNEDFIMGIAMKSCLDCGRDAFALEEKIMEL